jgi:hypothetical protein
MRRVGTLRRASDRAVQLSRLNQIALPSPILTPHVIARLANRAQRAAIFGQEGLVEVLGEILRMQTTRSGNNPTATILLPN